jgi:hypothetical protein
MVSSYAHPNPVSKHDKNLKTTAAPTLADPIQSKRTNACKRWKNFTVIDTCCLYPQHPEQQQDIQPYNRCNNAQH